MSQMAKVILKVIDNRLKARLKSMFMKHSLGLEKTCLCFVDFEKTFDMVRHEVLMERLRDLGDRSC